MEKAETNITAYPQTEEAMQDILSKASIDVESFKQNLLPCSLAKCHGMCCYDGVYVGQTTAEVIQRIVEEESQMFAAIQLDLPTEVIVDGEWEGMVAGKKTAVKTKEFSSLVPDYPSHFNATACVFLLDDGRCGLQVVSEAKGLHPWYYKPFTCWMHPISMTSVNNQVTLTVYNDSNDPYKLPNYDGFTSKTYCGKVSNCGQPAYRVLEAELKFLSRMVGRNFTEEIQRELTDS
jgi:Protein of unknown function (DUF3109)